MMAKRRTDAVKYGVYGVAMPIFGASAPCIDGMRQQPAEDWKSSSR